MKGVRLDIAFEESPKIAIPVREPTVLKPVKNSWWQRLMAL
jgi:hypothetical protein